MLDALRDPIWQFVGVAVSVLVAAGSMWAWRQRTRRDKVSRTEKLNAGSRQETVGGYVKHKKRKPDGILLANISSDFLNQFPETVDVLAAHLARLYTPENFGHASWLDVFRRLSAEGYFVPVDGTPLKRIDMQTALADGPELKHWLDATARSRREIQGLE